MNKRIHISKRIGAIFLSLALLCGVIVSTGAFPVTVTADADATVEKFTADFSTLTAGAVSAKADVEYLTSKFKFYYEQEGTYFQRKNVNDYYVDADGNPITTVQETDIDVYYPDTGEKHGSSRWVDGIGRSAADNGIATWSVTGDGMLYVANSSAGLQCFRRYNQAVVLDGNGDAAVLKNFRLKMDFKLYDANLSHMTIAFRAKSEVATVDGNGGTADRALLSLNKNGYFVGGPTDTYESNAYADHFKQYKTPTLNSYNFGTTTVYTLDLQVIGNQITATVYNGDTVVTTIEKETLWTDEGYLVLGGSNAGAQFDNIIVTRLDDNGNAIDFDGVERFKADFESLTAGAVSAATDVEYLTNKFHFWYAQETHVLFRRPNVNDFWVDANGVDIPAGSLTTDAKTTVYTPDTGAPVELNRWADYVGNYSSGRGKSVWMISDDGMLYQDATYQNLQAYRRYNQLTVLDANGTAASLKNFELTMNFKLRSESGLDTMTVAFRAATEATKVGFADRAVVAFSPKGGYFIGGPEAENYAEHTDSDKDLALTTLATALNTTSTYTLNLRVVGNNIETTVYNADGTVAFENTTTTTWTDEGYLVLGGSSAGAQFDNIVVTRLDDNGKEVDFTTKKFIADFSALTPGAVSATADVEYLTSKFKFYYEQEGTYFQRKNVNDYYVDADGNPITTVQETDIDVYYPDTGEKHGSSQWVDGIGRNAAGNGIATWTVDENGMLHVANSSAGSQYFRRYNQAVVLDANGAPASLKNFKLKMDFKLSASGLSHTTVAFRAKNEVGTVNSSGSSADRALVSLNPSGYFIGGPTDTYENNAYKDHFNQDKWADVKSYAFNTSIIYTLDLHVVGNKITATVYNGSTVVTTFEKETNWTDEGYIVIGGSNAGGYYDNIEITRLDDDGEAIDFTPVADPGPGDSSQTVKTFKADFSTLTPNTFTSDDLAYLTGKFNFYYEQEGTYFLRKNVNDYYVDADGNPITTVQETDIDVYYPDTGEKHGSSQWVDGIGRNAAGNGIATWKASLDGMLYVANSSAGSQYFRRYNQMVVLDAYGEPASLKNFKLEMDFKLSASGLSHTTVAFRAKNEVATVNSNGSSADRALVSLNPSGYFIGGPTDTYENNAYKDHFNQDKWADVKSYAFNTSTVYTLELHVVGSKITATVYNGSTVVTTFEKETNWTDEGYIVIGGSNAGGYYGNIEITRLDSNGNPIDFDAVGQVTDCPWDTTADIFSESMDASSEELERLYDFYYSDAAGTKNEQLSAHWVLHENGILMRQNDLEGNATEKVAMIRYNPDGTDAKFANFDATFKLSIDENESGTFWVIGRQTDNAKLGKVVETAGDTDYVAGQVAVGFAVGGELTVADGTADPVVIDGSNVGTPTGSYTVRVRLYGSKLEVYVDGMQKLSRTLGNTDPAKEGYLTFGYSGAKLGIGSVRIIRLNEQGVSVDLTGEFVSVEGISADPVVIKKGADVPAAVQAAILAGDLPETVTVLDKDGNPTEAQVYWDTTSVDSSIEGDQYLIGYLKQTGETGEPINAVRAVAPVQIGSFDPDITTLYNFDDETQLNDFESWFMPTTNGTDQPALHVEGTPNDPWYISNGKLSYKNSPIAVSNDQSLAGVEIDGVLYQETRSWAPYYANNFGVAVLKTREYENFILEVDIKSSACWTVVGFGAQDSADGKSVFSTHTNGGYGFYVESSGGRGNAKIWGNEPGTETCAAFATQLMDPYVIDGSMHHYKIIVSDGVAYFYLDDIDIPLKVELPDTYNGGYIYLGVNNTVGGFDNLKITDLDKEQINITNVLSAFDPMEIDRKAGDTLSLPSTVLTEDENGYEYVLPVQWLNSVYRSYLDGEFTFDADLQPYHNMTVGEGAITQIKAVNKINGDFDSEKSVKYYFDHPNDFLDFSSQYSQENYNDLQGYHSGYEGVLVEDTAAERWTISNGRVTPNYNYASGAWNGKGFSTGISTMVLKDDDLKLKNFRVEMDYTQGSDSWYSYMLVGVQDPGKMYGEVYWGGSGGTWLEPAGTSISQTFHPEWGGGAWVYLEQEGYFNVRGGISANNVRYESDYSSEFIRTYDKTIQHHMVVEVLNGTLSITVDDSDVYKVELLESTLGGYVGFATHGNGATYDNFQVTALDAFGNEIPLNEAEKGMAATSDTEYIGWQPDREKWEFEWGPEYEQ